MSLTLRVGRFSSFLGASFAVKYLFIVVGSLLEELPLAINLMQLLILLLLRSIQILIQFAAPLKAVVLLLSLVLLGLPPWLLFFVLWLLQPRNLLLFVFELLVFSLDVLDFVFEVFELVFKRASPSSLGPPATQIWSDANLLTPWCDF